MTKKILKTKSLVSVLNLNIILGFGLTFVVFFESYCVLVFSYLRNG